MVHFEEKAHYDLQDLRQIVHLLRAPGEIGRAHV